MRILDNLFLAQELLRGYSCTSVFPRCMMIVDIRKALDTLSWSFLFDILEGFGFPPHMIRPIKEGVTITSFSLSFNGGLYDFFHGKRGLRQGDPLSPYLFILVMEYLSKLFKFNTKKFGFKFQQKCKTFKITHLAFADDFMIFSKGDIFFVQVVIQTLKQFENAYGLAINPNKYNIFAAGIKEDVVLPTLDSTKFPVVLFLPDILVCL